MGSYSLTKEDWDKLGLEIGVWYSLMFDGATVKVYDANGNFIKEETMGTPEDVAAEEYFTPPEKAKDSFNEWREEYPDGTHILWHDYAISGDWLLGTIIGTHFAGGETVLLFRLDSDSPRQQLPRMLSIRNRKLLRKVKHTELDIDNVRKLWESGEGMMQNPIKPRLQ